MIYGGSSGIGEGARPERVKGAKTKRGAAFKVRAPRERRSGSCVAYGLGRNANADGDVFAALGAIGHVGIGANCELARNGRIVIDFKRHALARLS